MTDYVLSLVLLVAATVPVVAACWTLARALVADTFERVALAVFLATAQVVLTMQFLGAVGQWKRLTLLLAAWAGSALVYLVARRVDAPETVAPETETVEEFPRWVRLGLLGALLTLGAAGLLAAAYAMDSANDSLLYHRPMVAAWLRTGTIWRIGAFENGSTYEGAFWSNGDVFSLWFAVPYGRDYLVQMSSLVWATGCLLATACAARHLGLRLWSALLVGAVFATSPNVVAGQLNALHIDTMVSFGGAAMLWFGLRWMRSDDRVLWLALAGVAAGLAVGAKQSALPITGVFLVVLMVLAVRRGQWAGALLVVAGAVTPCLVWVARNWALRGNPFWPVDFGPLKGAKGAWEFDTDKSALRALRENPGETLKFLVVGLCLYGPVVALAAASLPRMWRWAKEQRLLWFGILAPLLAYGFYLVSPTTGQNRENILLTQRYFSPAIAAAVLVLGACRLAGERGRVRRWQALLVATVVFDVLVVAAGHLIPGLFRWPPWTWVGGLALGVLGAWLVVDGRLGGLPRRARWVLPVAAAVVVAGSAAPAKAARWYPYNPAQRFAYPVYDWLRSGHVHGKNIDFVGLKSAPLVGKDLSNNVFWLGQPTANHGVKAWEDEAAWERALQRACVDFLVVRRPHIKKGQRNPGWGRDIPEWGWAERSAIMTPVLRTSDVAVYRVRYDTPLSRCRPPE